MDSPSQWSPSPVRLSLPQALATSAYLHACISIATVSPINSNFFRKIFSKNHVRFYQGIDHHCKLGSSTSLLHESSASWWWNVKAWIQFIEELEVCNINEVVDRKGNSIQLTSLWGIIGWSFALWLNYSIFLSSSNRKQPSPRISMHAFQFSALFLFFWYVWSLLIKKEK